MTNNGEKISASNVRYLLALFELSKDSTGVKSSDIAERLNITKPSVHTMVKRFVQKGYVTQEKYEAIHLTAEGRRLARLYRQCFALFHDAV